jgi:hypothetical protein
MIACDLAFSINPPIFLGGITERAGFLIYAEKYNVRELMFQKGEPILTEGVVMG